MKKRAGYIIEILAVLLTALLSACSPVKHVPAGQYLLEDVNITVDGNCETLTSTELYNFLRQTPNHKVLGFAKLSLGAYNLSGRDSTKWYNRWLQRAGQPPVIYDASLAEGSRQQLTQALINSGYMDAWVELDSFPEPERKRTKLKYTLHPGQPFRVHGLGYNIPDTAIRAVVMADINSSLLRPGMYFDRTVLDQERSRLTRLLQNRGYFHFNRDYINFRADTVAGSKELSLTVNVHSPEGSDTRQYVAPGEFADTRHHKYYIRNVTFYLDREGEPADTIRYRGMRYIYGDDRYLKPSILDEMCYLTPGSTYSQRGLERTYEALGRLPIIKFVNITTEPCGSIGDAGLVDVTVNISRNKKQAVTVELEGTNSEGDLGFGVGLGYQHRNLAHGSESFSAKFRASYESLSGKFEDLVNNRYSEYAGEVGITFPKFECPFLSRSFKQRVLATSEFAVSFNYQERPEYTRIIAGTSWRWKWQQSRPKGLYRHTYDLVDINYVRLPRSTIDFIDQIAPSNPLLRYSYEDHFIMRTGYTYWYTNRRIPNTQEILHHHYQPSVTSVRASAETAGNLLYAISNAVGQHRQDGVYKILGIQYAQYVKGEVDYTFTRNMSWRSAVSFHVGTGLCYPYGNSTMVPFEKRFYAGGANGVRGWSVRTLGPGSYDAQNSVTDFINQCGDIRLDLSVEYRAKLFWVLEGAVFIDAGNIWTIKDYETQPGGFFRFNKFYKEIAAAYGIGLRMDFTYFLLRFDLGMKAHNPAQNQERWPIVHPKWSRDANFHFAVGYPF